MIGDYHSVGRRCRLYHCAGQPRRALRDRQRTRCFHSALPASAEKSQRVSFSYPRSSQKCDNENRMGETADVYGPSHSHGIRSEERSKIIELREKITARHCVTLSLSQFCVIISSYGKVLKAPMYVRKGCEYRMTRRSRESVTENVLLSDSLEFF